VIAAGPGVGPAVGIPERTRRVGREALVVYQAETPIYQSRLDHLREEGAEIVVVGTANELSERIRGVPEECRWYVFGYAGFVNDVKTTLGRVEVDPADMAIESFGPA
jgi:ferredoxin-NADP reductase